MTPQEIDQRLAVLAVLTQQIKAEDAALRDMRRESIRPGQRSPVLLPGDDTELAWVSMTKPAGGGRLTADVVDMDALTGWCRQHRPSALTETVRPSDQRVLCDEVRSTGEVIPGIELRETTVSQPTLRVNVESDAWPRLLAAVRDGRVDPLAAIAPPALTEGATS